MIRKDGPVTLAHIAAHASVSVNTVAKVLAGQAKTARISDKTVDRVRTIADQLGYIPNQLARSLRSHRTGLVGVFIADMIDPVYADITHAILQNLPDEGLSPVLTVAEAGLEQCLQIWLRNRVEAVILCGTVKNMNQQFFDDLFNIHVPMIITGNAFRGVNGNLPMLISTVHVDNAAGIILAVEHLRQTGRNRIAYISGPTWHSDEYERQITYRSAVEHFQQPLVIGSRLQSPHWQLGYTAARKIIDRHSDCDSIIAYDDLVALGAIKCLTDNKINIPQQISVVGFDDLPNSQYSIPSLTSIRQPTFQIGLSTVGLLKKLLSTQNSIDNIRIAPEITIRESSR